MESPLARMECDVKERCVCVCVLSLLDYEICNEIVKYTTGGF